MLVIVGVRNDQMLVEGGANKTDDAFNYVVWERNRFGTGAN